MGKKIINYFKKLRKYDFKKRFISSASILFFVGFMSFFIFYFFDLAIFDFDLNISGFKYFYYALLMGCIGIIISLIYSSLKNINFAIALVNIFILICLIVFSYFLVIITFILIIGTGTFG